MHSSIRSFSLQGPAGPLEALLNEGTPHASHAAVVTHPHPLYGGTLHNKVVFHATKTLNALGLPVLRFNFRGAGLSTGEHDHGIGEVDDVRAALDWLDLEFHLPLIFAGFSFGAAVGLRAACPDPRVQAVIALGTPISPVDDRSYDYDFLKPVRNRSCSSAVRAINSRPRRDCNIWSPNFPTPRSWSSSKPLTIFSKAACARCATQSRPGRNRSCNPDRVSAASIID